jgi:hypothetical protein
MPRMGDTVYIPMLVNRLNKVPDGYDVIIAQFLISQDDRSAVLIKNCIHFFPSEMVFSVHKNAEEFGLQMLNSGVCTTFCRNWGITQWEELLRLMRKE